MLMATGLALAGCAAETGPECPAVAAELRPLAVAEWSDALAGGGLFEALRGVRLALERQLVSHDEWIALGWCEYRADEFDAAKVAFREALGRVRFSVDAALGLGYVALRQDRPAAAADWFIEALRRDPASADAAEGLRMAAERLPDGHPVAARIVPAAAGLAATAPDSAEWLVVQALADRKSGGPGELRLRAPRPAEYPEHFARAGEDYLELRQPDGTWQPLFVKGVNIGPARPGHYPSEAPRDVATWREWLKSIAGLGANAVRVYTLQPPAFYRALAEHNAAGQAGHLWLIHGVWAELPPGDDFDEPAYLEGFHARIRRVIDAVHGDLVVAPARGNAHGVYDVDVSAHTLAWVIGREWEPFAVVAYDAMHRGACSHEGRFVSVDAGRAMECWIGRSLDFAAGYEARRHGAGRPLTFANWPTLDPLRHETEASRAEEDLWRLELEGIPLPERSAPAWDDDAISVDATRLSGTRRFGPGVFASYHIYPNFPYFMNLEPAYAEARDEEGVNRYLGYLRALKEYHGPQPVLVAEFGMSTSRGIAHLQPEGLHHGGQHEPESMRQVGRLARSIHAAGMAGGVAFEFMDEWFKGTWSTSPFEVPEDHRPFWFNAESPEQSYGLWAARPASHVRVDGRAEDWASVPPLLEARAADSGSWQAVRKVRATYDAGYVYVLLETAASFSSNWDDLHVALGIDTYDPERGERQLPSPADCTTSSGVEFAILLQGPGRSELRVTPPYRQRHPAESGATGVMLSPETPTGRFERPVLTTNRERYTRSGQRVPPAQIEPGRLRFGSLDPADPGFDTRSDVAVDAAGGVVELRLPWGLLNFGDPSTAAVLHQEQPGDTLATRTTPGIRLQVCAWDPADPSRVQRLPARGALIPIMALEPWRQPGYVLEPKHGLDAVARAFRALPDVPRRDARRPEVDR